MKHVWMTIAALSAAALPIADASAQPPAWSKEQTAVWEVISQSWADETARNGKWPEAYAADQMVSWEPDWPMPRYKDSLTKWSRFNDKQRKSLEYEIWPAAITLSGDTAVVNYTAVQISQRAEEKPERDSLGITETLVRRGGSWKFLATTGFNLKK